MKIYAMLAILVLVIGLGWRIYYLGGDNARLEIKVAKSESTIEQLEKDSAKLKELTTLNRKLSRRVEHATRLYAQVQDPTGCFRAPIPDAAAIELWNLYNSITGEKRPPFIREVRSYIPN